MREAGCSTESYHSPALAQVRTVLSSPDRVPSVDATLEALALAYGEAVTQTSALVDYIWIKVDGHWLLWCVGGATIEVDLGLAGTAVVKVREPMPLPQS